jgi:hypothetical protein
MHFLFVPYEQPLRRDGVFARAPYLLLLGVVGSKIVWIVYISKIVQGLVSFSTYTQGKSEGGFAHPHTSNGRRVKCSAGSCTSTNDVWMLLAVDCSNLMCLSSGDTVLGKVAASASPFSS